MFFNDDKKKQTQELFLSDNISENSDGGKKKNQDRKTQTLLEEKLVSSLSHERTGELQPANSSKLILLLKQLADANCWCPWNVNTAFNAGCQ